MKSEGFQVFNDFFHAYLRERDLDKFCAMVSENVVSIGTGKHELCVGKAAFREMARNLRRGGIFRDFFRRRLAKKLLVTGTPLTTITQILGHDDPKSARQYLSLDTSSLKECALDFKGIPLERGLEG